MSDNNISYEEHVQKNNARLVSIRMALGEAVSFPSACEELTAWCGDQRAFSAAFEENLLAALQVAVENASKEEFDFALANTLISTCFSHRKLLSKAGAARINRWYEQFRRLRKNGGRKKKRNAGTEATTAAAPVAAQEPMEGATIMLADETITVTDSGTMWAGGPLPNGQAMQSPSYGPMGGAANGMAPAYGSYPMDPSRAGYPAGAANYDQNAMMMQQQRQQQMMMQQQAMARRGMTAGYDPNVMYPTMPMGANSVPGQAHPLMRYPMGTSMMPSPSYPIGSRPTAAAMNSPVYPGHPQNPQMIRAGAPVMYGHVQQPMQSQPVHAYPNPNAPPDGMIPMAPPPYQQRAIPVMKMPLLQPFALQHGVTMSNFNFEITQEQYQYLTQPAWEVQLKSYHKEDKMMKTHWPTPTVKNPAVPAPPTPARITVKVTVNGSEIPLLGLNQSAYIKRALVVGTNNIEFTVFDCACSHVFAVQMVMFHSIPHISTMALHRYGNDPLKNTAYSKDKFMRLLNGQSCRLSLRNQQGRIMNLPCRSIHCQHTACFDLEPYVNEYAEASAYICPICQVPFKIEDFEVDFFVGTLGKELQTQGRMNCDVLVNGDLTYKFVEAEPVVAASPAATQAVAAAPATASTSRKRGAAITDESSGFSIKRIKSEPGGLTATPPPFPAGPPGSVPNAGGMIAPSPAFPGSAPTGGPIAPSPAYPGSVPNANGPIAQSPMHPGSVSNVSGRISQSPALLSPYNHQSPMKALSALASPAFGRQASQCSDAPSLHIKQEPQDLNCGSVASTSEAKEIKEEKSPHQQHVQQHGSFDTASLAGSAPYTPSSVGSGLPSLHLNPLNGAHGEQPNAQSQLHNSSASLDIDVLDGMTLITTTVWSPEDIQKYIDADIFCTTFDDVFKKDPSMNTTWDDIQSLITSDKH